MMIKITMSMSTALQSTQGRLNEIQITMAKMCSSMMHERTLRKDNSTSNKRKLDDDAVHLEADCRTQESLPDVPTRPSEKSFSDFFRGHLKGTPPHHSGHSRQRSSCATGMQRA